MPTANRGRRRAALGFISAIGMILNNKYSTAHEPRTVQYRVQQQWRGGTKQKDSFYCTGPFCIGGE